MSDTQKLPKSDLCFYCGHLVDLANRGSVALGDKVAHLQCALEPRDTQNQWVSVNERLPEKTVEKLVLLTNGERCVAFIGGVSGAWTIPGLGNLTSKTGNYVTHWMDLPEPPAPPKPADPFDVWWESTDRCRTVRAAWNAAKAHYERPLPNFEAWCKKQGGDGIYVAIRIATGIHMVHDDVVRSIWNAAQGKPEA